MEKIQSGDKCRICQDVMVTFDDGDTMSFLTEDIGDTVEIVEELETPFDNEKEKWYMCYNPQYGGYQYVQQKCLVKVK